MSANPAATDSRDVAERDELRRHLARVLEEHATTILNDALALFGFTGMDVADRETTARIGEMILYVLIAATRDGEVDARSAQVAALRRYSRDKRITVKQLFELVYIVERAGLDELALDESFGATSEPWPALAQLTRRSSFAALAGFAERLSHEAGEDALNDALTTLHTRAVLLAVLEKEIQRAERFAHPFALILFDVDRLGEINATRGFDFGDRLLERIGIVLRNYFREQDWVCRWTGDKFAVLLPETPGEHAEQLAERVRVTVQDRMALRDYKSDEQVLVTVSAGLVVVDAVDASVRAGQVTREAEQTVQRAKHGGRNRVERAEINVRTTQPPPRGVEPL
jgi:diguanylate cyclase (GGDEF)-like protein